MKKRRLSDWILQKKRRKKEVKKRRLKILGKKEFTKGRAYQEKVDFILKYDRRIYENSKFKLKSYLDDVGFFDNIDLSNKVVVSGSFSLSNNYEASILVIKKFIFSVYNVFYHRSKLIIDFSKCTQIDLGSLFLLQIFRIEMMEEFKKINSRLRYLKIEPEVEIIESENFEVNKVLLINGFITKLKANKELNELIPRSGIGFLRGSKRQIKHVDNKKSKITTKIAEYVNNCLNDIDLKLTFEGRNKLDKIIAEVLSNAEDHSPFEIWYATANFLINKSEVNPIGELNLGFYNFGGSIYDGLMETRDRNKEIFDYIDNHATKSLKIKSFSNFNKEDLFTLYAMQDGISRLKFEKESRGSGTMSFINSFFAIGDFEDESRNLFPSLKVYTGKTLLICNKKYKPQLTNDSYKLSLNSENDLELPPDPSNLIQLKSKLPGTMLSVKVFLNKKHLLNKINNGKHTK
ncbi:hypothetical protein [Echinicola shivajiensis]|uniref:hypothetical protein n=1 Tax=Echinicola shivajiensis TaxID=1035916 RepID=UPI001BFC8A52|nr:hypothetical protein [Echinicola shivajiensis]